MADSKKPSTRIPKARRVARSKDTRVDVTRAEFNRLIDSLNDGNDILNGLREGLLRLERATDVQFQRIAQMQAELDLIKRAWERIRLRS